MAKRLFTSESVTEGHPDKMCDQISDSVLDSIIALDPNARVACETAVTRGMVMVMGEISTDCYVDIAGVARTTVADIGYTRAKYGFDAETCAVICTIDEQSSDIAGGVNHALEERLGGGFDIGAGDQGMMFGFACDQTEALMPMPIFYAHKLARRLSVVRKEGILDYLRPDGKTQVSVEYDGDKPVRIDTVLISAQHHPDVDQKQMKEDIIEEVVKACIPARLLDAKTNYYVNPSGRFVIGGPAGDSGLTGRKIIVDTYGGYGRHGGGSFSGKDPTKVDRSAAYAARHAAKNIVGAGLARACEIEVAYAIGVAHPVSVLVETFGTGVLPDDVLENAVKKVFDLRPSAIISRFDLRRPLYRQVATYGHFGRTDLDLPWEKLDHVDELKKELKV